MAISRGLVIDGGLLFMVLRRKRGNERHDMWELPGGGIDEGEVADNGRVIRRPQAA